MVKIANSIVVGVPAKRAFEVITQFSRYPKFLHDITEAKVLKSTAKKAQVAFQIKMIQKVDYTLEFTLTPDELAVWKFIKGDPVLKDNSGSWRIEAQTPKKTVLFYEANIELSIWIPESMLKSILEENLPKICLLYTSDAADE